MAPISEPEIDEDDIPLAVLRLSNDLFGVDYAQLDSIDNEVHTCQAAADWDKSAMELLADCQPKCSDDYDDDNTDIIPDEPTPPTLNDASSLISVIEITCFIHWKHFFPWNMY